MPSQADLDELFYRNQPEEFAFAVTAIDGTIPADLRGAFLRNGPGVQKVGNDYLNFFDGHGLISGVGFRDGRAFFRSRHVRTELFEKESRAGRMLERRVFTNRPGMFANMFNLKIGNPAAHDVYCWGGRIYATGDTHYALDPLTFDTIGPERWGLPSGHQQGLMTRADPSIGHLIAYAVKPGGRVPDEITCFEFDRELNVLHRVSAPLRRAPSLVHDVAFTERYFVVIQLPARLRLLALLAGRKTLWDSLEWGEGDRPLLTLLPRRPGARALSLPLPPPTRVPFHMLNAYDDGDRVMVDTVGAFAPIDFNAFAPAAMRQEQGLSSHPTPDSGVIRYDVDVNAGTLDASRLGDATGEQPEINAAYHGRKYRHAYLRSTLADGSERDPKSVMESHGITKLDTTTGQKQTWSAGRNRFAGQPAFAPRAAGTDEDDGYLLNWVLDGDSGHAEVVILDARDLGKPPLATLHLGRYLCPPGHAAFDASVDLAAV